jgi:hypothetical protein
MKRYRVKFDRVGRNRTIGPLTANADSLDDLALEIFRYVRPHLRSRDLDVCINTDGASGFLACGMHSGGDFTISETL